MTVSRDAEALRSGAERVLRYRAARSAPQTPRRG
jgi:hypothetical protein